MTRQVPNNIETQTGTVSNTALTLTTAGFVTAANIEKADRLILSVTDDAIRYRKDGTAPTATVGHYLAADSDPLVIEGHKDVISFQFIRVTTDAKYIMELEG